jgi:hypothetical protein
MVFGKKENFNTQNCSSNMESSMKASSKMGLRMGLANYKSMEINILVNLKWIRNKDKALLYCKTVKN